MTKVRFLRHDGEVAIEVEAEAGSNLLDLAQAHGQPLEGSCEKAMACSTCHVIVAAEDFERLAEASEEEDDLLDFAAHVSRTSRLACQCAVPDGKPFTVTIPPSSVNWENK